MRALGAIDPDVRAALDAKLVELNSAYDAMAWRVRTSPVQSAQDALYGEGVRNAVLQTRGSIDLLSGDLYSAVLGEHVFPLDDGAAADPEAALAIWNKIAVDVQGSIDGVMGYTGKWLGLPGFKSALPEVANPLNWPWYVQVAAGGAVLYYGLSFVGMIGSARSAFHGRRRRR